MVGGSPAPASSGASLASVTGSFSSTRRDDAAVDDLVRVACAPSSGVREGHGTSFRSAAASRAPIASGRAATTT